MSFGGLVGRSRLGHGNSDYLGGIGRLRGGVCAEQSRWSTSLYTAGRTFTCLACHAAEAETTPGWAAGWSEGRVWVA